MLTDTEKAMEMIFSSDLTLVRATLNNPLLFEAAAKSSFKLIDTNKDNKISLNEFEIFLLEIEKKTYPGEKTYLNKELIEKTFKDFDYDMSGNIEFNEFKDIFKDLVTANLMGLE